MRKLILLPILGLIPLVQAQTTVTGTGFFFSSDGYLLTNFHVVNGCQTVSLNISGVRTSAPVLFGDAKDDIAVLKRDNPPAYLSFRDERLRLGENVIAVGYPLAGVIASSMNLTTGTVSALAGLGEDTRMIQFTAPVQPGNSGGPLLDQSGHIIGMIASKLSPLWAAANIGDIPENVNFAIKASVLRDFLESKGINYASSVSMSNVPTPKIGEQSRDAVVSIECLPTSPPEVSADGRPSIPGISIEARRIERLRDVKTVALGDFGRSEAAGLVREKLSNRLLRSGRVAVVEDPRQADAVLTGVVGADIYGRADTAVFKLVTREGKIIWGGEHGRAGWGSSASSSVAGGLASELVKAIEADDKVH